MARYRIHFVASFNQTVEANNQDEARAIARDLAALAMFGVGEEGACAWNTIEPLEAADPPLD